MKSDRMYIVSACLLGENCKYSGGNNLNKDVVDYLEGKQYISVCPEVLGGLPTPRTPAEIVEEKVISKSGEDITDEFNRGAEETLSIAKENGAEIAILKARSPSCGYGKIYDGSFSGKLINGKGKTAELLEKNGITIFTEEDLQSI